MFGCIMLIFTPFYHITKKSSPQLVSSCRDDLVLQRMIVRICASRGIGANQGIHQCLHWWMKAAYAAFGHDSNPRWAPKKHRHKVFFGAPAGIRTPDTLLKRQVLCLLSYWGVAGMAGLEPTISESKSGVLPLHYIPIGREQRRFSVLLLKQAGAAGLLFVYGVGYGARTHDTRNHNPVLYQLS